MFGERVKEREREIERVDDIVSWARWPLSGPDGWQTRRWGQGILTLNAKEHWDFVSEWLLSQAEEKSGKHDKRLKSQTQWDSIGCVGLSSGSQFLWWNRREVIWSLTGLVGACFANARIGWEIKQTESLGGRCQIELFRVFKGGADATYNLKSKSLHGTGPM